MGPSSLWNVTGNTVNEAPVKFQHDTIQTQDFGIARYSDMMTSSNGNIFRVSGPLCGEFTGHRWIPLTKASDAEHWCFLWNAPE